MDKNPYLIPANPISEQSLSSPQACEGLLRSFIPTNGLNQFHHSPSNEFRKLLTQKDFKHSEVRMPLLYMFSVHPRESVRMWVESALLTYIGEDRHLPTTVQPYLDTIFPWNHPTQYFEFTTTRALFLSRHQTITPAMAEFLIGYNHESISIKLIDYIIRNITGPEVPITNKKIQKLLIKIATHHLPNSRRTIAKNRALNWRVFDELLERGLPLHALDAITHVNWKLYAKYASEKQRNDVVRRIKLFAKHDSFVRNIVKDWQM